MPSARPLTRSSSSPREPLSSPASSTPSSPAATLPSSPRTSRPLSTTSRTSQLVTVLSLVSTLLTLCNPSSKPRLPLTLTLSKWPVSDQVQAAPPSRSEAKFCRQLGIADISLAAPPNVATKSKSLHRLEPINLMSYLGFFIFFLTLRLNMPSSLNCILSFHKSPRSYNNPNSLWIAICCYFLKYFRFFLISIL